MSGPRRSDTRRFVYGGNGGGRRPGATGIVRTPDYAYRDDTARLVTAPQTAGSSAFTPVDYRRYPDATEAAVREYQADLFAAGEVVTLFRPHGDRLLIGVTTAGYDPRSGYGQLRCYDPATDAVLWTADATAPNVLVFVPTSPFGDYGYYVEAPTRAVWIGATPLADGRILAFRRVSVPSDVSQRPWGNYVLLDGATGAIDTAVDSRLWDAASYNYVLQDVSEAPDGTVWACGNSYGVAYHPAGGSRVRDYVFRCDPDGSGGFETRPCLPIVGLPGVTGPVGGGYVLSPYSPLRWRSLRVDADGFAWVACAYSLYPADYDDGPIGTVRAVRLAASAVTVDPRFTGAEDKTLESAGSALGPAPDPYFTVAGNDTIFPPEGDGATAWAAASYAAGLYATYGDAATIEGWAADPATYETAIDGTAPNPLAAYDLLLPAGDGAYGLGSRLSRFVAAAGVAMLQRPAYVEGAGAASPNGLGGYFAPIGAAIAGDDVLIANGASWRRFDATLAEVWSRVWAEAPASRPPRDRFPFGVALTDDGRQHTVGSDVGTTWPEA